MSFLLLAGGALAVALLVYLAFALLFPEKLS
jgi:K+-transporting ATPase KdpF subunit